MKGLSFVFVLFFIFRSIFISAQVEQEDSLYLISFDSIPFKILQTNPKGKGPELRLVFHRGQAHLNPLFAFWYEDSHNNYIETLYVSEAIASGIFKYGKFEDGFWKPGEVRQPAALPVWAHRRKIQAKDGLYLPSPDDPVPDAFTGSTPSSNFIISTKLKDSKIKLINLFFEINQPNDWNEYFHSDKHPEDPYYMASGQPSLIYKVTINLDDRQQMYFMKLIGYGHYAGQTGEIFTDLEKISSAKYIVEKILIYVHKK